MQSDEYSSHLRLGQHNLDVLVKRNILESQIKLNELLGEANEYDLSSPNVDRNEHTLFQSLELPNTTYQDLFRNITAYIPALEII